MTVKRVEGSNIIMVSVPSPPSTVSLPPAVSITSSLAVPVQFCDVGAPSNKLSGKAVLNSKNPSCKDINIVDF